MNNLHKIAIATFVVAVVASSTIVTHAQTMTTDNDSMSTLPQSTYKEICVISPRLQVWYILTNGGPLKVTSYLTAQEIADYETQNATKFVRNELGVLYAVWKSEICPEGTQQLPTQYSCFAKRDASSNGSFLFVEQTPQGKKAICSKA